MVLDMAVLAMERGLLMLSPRQRLMLIFMEDMEDMVLDTAVDFMERGPLMLSPRQRLMLIFMEDMVLDTAVVSTMDKKQLSALSKQKLKAISDWLIVVNQCPLFEGRSCFV